MKVTLRPATIKDAKLVYEWRMDPETRKQSHISTKFSWSSHRQWFAKHLSEMKIIQIAKVPVGQLRVCDGLVSIVIGREFRGNGIAAAALKILRPQSLTAEIKLTNVASIRAFEKAGFVKSFVTMVRR